MRFRWRRGREARGSDMNMEVGIRIPSGGAWATSAGPILTDVTADASLPGPGGGALFKERPCAFGLVGGAREPAEDAGLDGAGLFKGQAFSARDGLEATGDGERRHGGDRGGELPAAGEELTGGMDLVDEAEPECLRGSDHLSGEQQTERGGAADEAREALGSAVSGDEAELDLRLAEARGFAGKAHVAGERELATAAKREAVDKRDDGFAAGLDLAKDGLSPERLRLARGGVGGGELVDVGAGGKGLFARPGEQDDAHAGVFGKSLEGVLKLIEDLRVEGVQDLGAIECDECDVVFDVAEQGLVGHGVSWPMCGDVGQTAGGCCRELPEQGAAGEPEAAAPDDTIRPMIKGMTLVSEVSSGDLFAELSSLLSALGFESGRGWADGSGKGAAFLAPVGNLEIVTGRVPAVPSLLIEVTQLDEVHAAVRDWMLSRVQRVDSAGQISEPEATHWNSRLFTAELAPGLRLGFWQSENPLHGQTGAIEGDLSAAGMRFAVVVARWNAVITDRLLQGTMDALLRSGAARDAVEIVRVPGAWEIPSAARTLAETKRFDAVITLGVLLRGETAHYEAIYNEVARGIGQSQQETGVPHAFGVLTCETLEQALDRAGLKAGNKGFEAAVAAIEMSSIQRKIAAASASGARN